MKLAIVILVVVVLLVLWLAGTYNGLVKKKNAVEEAFSTMDVYLKKRWDLIPNLVNTVKATPLMRPKRCKMWSPLVQAAMLPCPRRRS